jgi:hypothetical protein
VRKLLIAGVILGCRAAPPPAPSVMTTEPSGLRSVIVSLDKLK